tara:strand:+ start:35 stop:1609 length:1575 start_codon:yes stop_codon:yes gene_type:complete
LENTIDIIITLNQFREAKDLTPCFASAMKISSKEIKGYKITKRSIDARKREIKINLRAIVYLDEIPEEKIPKTIFPQLAKEKSAVIIGFGPAGIFAAIKLLEKGIKPIIYERGKDVRARRRDLAAIIKQQTVNPDSNYCFGEGGAGTYSDGKLYTRSTKRGDVEEILNLFVEFGADPDILVDAHPHIGTNKLPQIIVAMRERIIEAGGEVHFNSKMTDILVDKGAVRMIQINHSEMVECSHLILATGHSARDIYSLLDQRKISIEAKQFAMGVRVEHPQELIDKIQYHGQSSDDVLPPAAYRIVKQVNGRGVYSFCMCPGGIIAPCATEPGEIVTNGWSPSRRNNPYANSGIVVPVEEKDYLQFGFSGPLGGMKYQAYLEHLAFKEAGNNIETKIGQIAPAQRLKDFVDGKDSNSLPDCSYKAGVTPVRLDQVLPSAISTRLRKGFELFGKSMRNYLSNDALIVGVESRTSSPVRIPRNRASLEHISVNGIYPCGEGAGYAGGIVSAAIDGIKCASAIAEKIAS